MRQIYCKRCIDHNLNPETRRLTPEQILEDACEFLCVDKKKVCSKSRVQRLVDARNMIANMLYSDSYLRMTLEEVGMILGKRHYSTIIHGNGQLETMLKIYPDTKDLYKRLHLHVYHTLMHYPYEM
jgi:chromosomal replication initiation ATPase DnaA